MSETQAPKSERAFLHDLCNSMAVAQGVLQLLIVKVQKQPTTISADDVLTKAKKALDAIEKMNKHVNDRRNVITEQA